MSIQKLDKIPKRLAYPGAMVLLLWLISLIASGYGKTVDKKFVASLLNCNSQIAELDTSPAEWITLAPEELFADLLNTVYSRLSELEPEEASKFITQLLIPVNREEEIRDVSYFLSYDPSQATVVVRDALGNPVEFADIPTPVVPRWKVLIGYTEQVEAGMYTASLTWHGGVALWGGRPVGAGVSVVVGLTSPDGNLTRLDLVHTLTTRAGEAVGPIFSFGPQCLLVEIGADGRLISRVDVTNTSTVPQDLLQIADMLNQLIEPSLIISPEN